MKSSVKTRTNAPAKTSDNVKDVPGNGPQSRSEYLAEVSADMPIAPSAALLEDEVTETEGFELKRSFNGGKGFTLFYGGTEVPLHSFAWNEKIELIKAGISKADLMGLKEKFGFTLEELSRILDITPRTIQGKRPSSKFTGNVAEKIVALAAIYSYGLEIFEEEEKFRRWLNAPSPILQNFKPVELLATMTGMEEVKQELGRIDYGVY